MWSRLKKFIQGDPRAVVPSIDSAVLGTLTYSEDDECWMTDENSACLPFQFFIAGNRDERFATIAPDAALVQHAESVALAPEAFLDAVSRFLASEIPRHSHLKTWEHEVAQLKVAALNLAWAHRPDDGMIEFKGPGEFRLWRCNYLNRVPAGPLGFDN